MPCEHTRAPCIHVDPQNHKKNPHTGISPELHGSMVSSLAATLATLPSVTLFRYTRGVLPAGRV